MMVMKDVTTTSGGEAQKSGEDQGTRKAEDWGAQGDDGGSICQVACHPGRWDNSERSSPNMGKGEAACGPWEVLVFARAKGKNKVDIDETSVVGLQKAKIGKEAGATSPWKPKQVSNEEDVVGLLDLGQSKDKKPKEKGRWKQLAREKGLAGIELKIAQKDGIGTKRHGKIEKLEIEVERKRKKNCEDGFICDVLMSDEMAVAARQHCREP